MRGAGVGAWVVGAAVVGFGVVTTGVIGLQTPFLAK